MISSRPVRLLFGLVFLAAGPLHAAEPAGTWQAPASDGRAWKHDATGLAFPQQLGTYRLGGVFEYRAGGVLVRYENLEERARADVFLFKAGAALPTVEDKHRRILAEMDAVVNDFEGMVRQGRYKNLQLGELAGGELELWQQNAIPIATRTLTATRLGVSSEGAVEAVIQQWVGITVFAEHVVTIRHMRPADTGEAGQGAMKTLVGLIFQLIKDPALRAHIQQLLDAYLAKPFSADGEQAAAAVLAYLKQTPYFPINIPEKPVAEWLEHFKAVAPGTQDTLLRAFMLGSAKAAFADADAEACLKEGARHFALIYRQSVKEHPRLSRPDIESFVAAAEKGLGASWLKDFSDSAR